MNNIQHRILNKNFKLIAKESIFNNILFGKIINLLMRRGKKASAEKVFLKCLAQCTKIFIYLRKFKNFRKFKRIKSPSDIIIRGILNVVPILGLSNVKKRNSKRNKLIPITLSFSKRVHFALKWILDCAKSSRIRGRYGIKSRGSKKPTQSLLAKSSLSIRLANEFFKACLNQGSAIEKKNELYKKVHAQRHNLRFAFKRKKKTNFTRLKFNV